MPQVSDCTFTFSTYILRTHPSSRKYLLCTSSILHVNGLIRNTKQHHQFTCHLCFHLRNQTLRLRRNPILKQCTCACVCMRIVIMCICMCMCMCMCYVCVCDVPIHVHVHVHVHAYVHMLGVQGAVSVNLSLGLTRAKQHLS